MYAYIKWIRSLSTILSPNPTICNRTKSNMYHNYKRQELYYSWVYGHSKIHRVCLNLMGWTNWLTPYGLRWLEGQLKLRPTHVRCWPNLGIVLNTLATVKAVLHRLKYEGGWRESGSEGWGRGKRERSSHWSMVQEIFKPLTRGH